jgi:acyl carrier protein
MSEAIERRVTRIVRRVLMLADATSVRPASRLRDDLGLDSLSAMTLLVDLEDGIPGFVADAETLTTRDFLTVASLTAYVEKTMGPAAATSSWREAHDEARP